MNCARCGRPKAKGFSSKCPGDRKCKAAFDRREKAFHKHPWELEVGDWVSNHILGYNGYTYEIVSIEDDVVTIDAKSKKTGHVLTIKVNRWTQFGKSYCVRTNRKATVTA